LDRFQKKSEIVEEEMAENKNASLSIFHLLSEEENVEFPGVKKVVLEHLAQQTVDLGRAMAQAVSRRSPTAEARVRSRVGPCWIYGGQRGTGTGFYPSTTVFPCQFHSTGAPFTWKNEKKTDHI
jgi:hypothetical protein